MKAALDQGIAPSAEHGRFFGMALTLGVTMAGATLASPLYPLYERALGITSTGITIAYASYMAGALLALLSVAHLSDHIGFVRALRFSVILLIGGLAISALAPSLLVLSLGRFLIGLAAGIASSSATAGLVALAPEGKSKRAPLVGSILNIVGLGTGPLLGGVVAQLLPHPLLTPYVVFAIAATAALITLLAFPADGGFKSVRHFRPRVRFHVPRSAEFQLFAIAASVTFAGYTLLSLFASLTPSLVASLLPWRGPGIVGITVATLFLGSAIAQFALRTIDVRVGLILGAASIGVAVILLAASILVQSGSLFVASDIIGGVGQGLAFISAIAIINRLAPAASRARITASFFSIAYLGGIVPIVGLGLLADLLGLDLAITGLAIVLGALTIGTATVTYRKRELFPRS